MKVAMRAIFKSKRKYVRFVNMRGYYYMEESLTGRIKETFGKNLITESFERLGE
jgi:hypothetical protein